MRLLTNEIREFIYNRPWPGGNRLIFDIDDATHVGDEYMPHLAFTLYRDNFSREFNTEEQAQIATIFQEIHKKLRDSGIPTTLEVKANVPRE